MITIDEIFKNKRLCAEQLVPYGFIKDRNIYKYSAKIVDNQFTMLVEVSASGEISAKVIDDSTKEEYVLHNISSAAGAFIGKVREDYEKVLKDISEQCYKKEIFKSADAKEIIKYVKDKYNDELEFLWIKLPDCAILRRKDNNKWYGLMLTVQKNKIGLEGDEKIEIFDMRMEPEDLENKVDNKKYFHGYHMNKKNWFTICLDGSIPMKEIENYVDESYELAAKKQGKKSITQFST
jgi:predicted DNA-binding protein (MmcQ/YjbR family)